MYSRADISRTVALAVALSLTAFATALPFGSEWISPRSRPGGVTGSSLIGGTVVVLSSSFASVAVPGFLPSSATLIVALDSSMRCNAGLLLVASACVPIRTALNVYLPF